MANNYKSLTGVLFLSFLSIILSAQSSIRGTIISEKTEEPVIEAKISIISTALERISDAKGRFSFEELDPGSYILKIEHPEYLSEIRSLTLRKNENADLGLIDIQVDASITDDATGAENLPSVTISQDDLGSGGEQGRESVSALLSASRDVFLSSVAYNFSAFRFDVRGLDSEYSTLLLNGVHMNDPESGRLYWSLWGGLNDVFRLRQNDLGMQMAQYGFGHINGASNIDLRASSQRKQFRVSYAVANRSYRNRVMATYSTGLLENGWAFTFSGSRRWAQEGYSPGTFYDAYAYFAGVEKKINSSHAIGLTVFGAPIRRGKSGAAVQEIYDLLGTNYYNPNWGYQNGEKRNSRVAHSHEPIAILRYDYTPRPETNISVSAMAQKGNNGSTALNWFDKTRDPRPNYYRKLPSYAENEEVREQVTEAWQTNTDVSQINWDQMYEVNSLSQTTLKNVLVDGNRQDITGKFARYLVEDRRYDGTQFAVNGKLTQIVGKNHEFNGGLNYNYSSNHNYTKVEDLLGADFYLDVDRFALRDSAQNEDFIQNDIDNPNRIVKEGDIFGYNYKGIVHRGQAWGQYQGHFSKWDLRLGASLTQTYFWRDGLVRNGKFPENSFGQSEKASFLDYAIKAGATYKISGRHYVYANAMSMTQAPYLRNSFVSIRTRDQLVPGLESEKILGGEIGYRWQAPKVKLKISGYYINYRDQFSVRSFFLDESGQNEFGNIIDQGFVNLVMTGINKRHMGLELAGQVELFPGLDLKGAFAAGEYIYTSRPNLSAFLDNNQAPVYEDLTVYQEGFYVAGTPQTIANIGLRYNSPDYWFANLNFNYYQDTYLDFFPLRRTQLAVQGVDEGTPLWRNIISQEAVEGGFTLDFFGGKSFKFGDDYFVYVNVGVNNLLNTQDLITGGYEQFRYRISSDFGTEQPDPDEFPRRYYYAYGTNYFISLTFKI